MSYQSFETHSREFEIYEVKYRKQRKKLKLNVRKINRNRRIRKARRDGVIGRWVIILITTVSFIGIIASCYVAACLFMCL